MAMYKLHYGTQAAYDAKKAAGTLIQDDLYFTSDTALIYKGDMLLSAAVEAVAEFPASGAQGRIYVNSETLEAKVWNGSAWVVVSPAVETTLTAETATGALVTAGAIRTYIENQIGSAAVVADVAYDEATQKITITYGDDTPDKVLELKNLVTDVAYDATTGNFTFSKANGEAKVVNTPVENFLSAASYDADTHVLTLTMESGDEVEVNLAALIKDVLVESTDSIALAIDTASGAIKANVKISPAAGNALTLKAAPGTDAPEGTTDESGLYISLANYYTKDEVDAAIKVVGDKVTALETAMEGVEGDLADKANSADVYLKTETYNKSEIEAFFTWQEI